MLKKKIDLKEDDWDLERSADLQTFVNICEVCGRHGGRQSEKLIQS